MLVNDHQVGGKHYQSEFQHWDFVQQVLCGRYLEGCITKYITRHRKKNGLQDLLKAEHYLTKLLSLYIEKKVAPLYACHRLTSFESHELIDKFCKANNLPGDEQLFMFNFCCWSGPHSLNLCHEVLMKIIAREKIIYAEIETMKQENP
jgi:hypothetical protein